MHYTACLCELGLTLCLSKLVLINVFYLQIRTVLITKEGGGNFPSSVCDVMHIAIIYIFFKSKGSSIKTGYKRFKGFRATWV